MGEVNSGKDTTSSATTTTRPKKYRSACDACHQSKVKCSGGTRCDGCQRLGITCKYSISNRTGRPQGVKNKKTLEWIKNLRESSSAEETPSKRPSTRGASPAQNNSKSSQEQPPQPAPTTAAADFSYNAGYVAPGPLADDPMGTFGTFLPTSAPDFSSDVDFFGSLELDSPHQLPTDRSFIPPPFDTLSGSNMQFTPDRLGWSNDMINNPTLTSFGAYDLSNAHDQLKGNVGVQDNGVARDRTMLHNRSRNSSLSTCDCLHQLTEQLANFKTLSRSQEPLSPDFVLGIARYALACWRKHLQCFYCKQTDDEDILALTVMCFRAVLNLIQGVSSPENGALNLAQGRQYSQEDLFDPANNETSSQSSDSKNSYLGSYELASDEKQMVVDLLLYRTLRNIGHTVKNVKQRSAKTDFSKQLGSSTSSATTSNFSLGSGVNSPSGVMNTTLGSHFNDLPGGFLADCAELNISVEDRHSYFQQSLQSLSETIEGLLRRLAPSAAVQ